MPCFDFISKGACRFGAGCKYSHGQQQRRNNDEVQRNDGNDAPSNKPPCNQFTERGHCTYGDRCKYSHAANITQTNNAPHSRHPYPQFDLCAFLKTTHIGAFEMTQYKIAEHAKRLAENVSDNVELVKACGQSAWLKRVVDQCGTRSSSEAGSASQTMSFQRITLPLLRLITSPKYLRIPSLRAVVDDVYRVFHGTELEDKESCSKFDFALAECLDKMFRDQSFEDRNFITTPELTRRFFMPANWSQVVGPVALYFLEIARKFPNDVGHPTFAFIEEMLEKGTREPYAPDYRNDYVNFKAIRELHEWAEGEHDLVGLRQRRAEQRLFEEMANNLQDEEMPEGGGPGQFSATGGPRHDNDLGDFRSIGIAPTQQELASMAKVYLPSTQANAWHHLVVAAGGFHLMVDVLLAFQHLSDARLLDTHFRLLREDFVRSLGARRDVTFNEQLSWPVAATVAVEPEPTRRPARFTQPLRVVSAQLCGLKVQSSRALGATIHFESLGKIDWESPTYRKWFAHGSLVRVEEFGGVANQSVVKGYFTVVERIIDGVGGASLVVSDLTSSEISRNIVAWLCQFDHRPAKAACLRLVHASDDFFAYQPVLLGLQKHQGLPFHGRFSSPTRMDQIRHVPQYLVGARFDLTGMLAENRTEADLSHFRQYDLFANGTPPQAWANRFKLDWNQLDAACYALTNEIAVIQGPPGTGKSFTGAAIVNALLSTVRLCRRVTTTASTTPILCICTTNHALDQFLHELMKTNRGIKIMRVGSRTKSTVLEEFSLFKHLGKLKRTPGQFNARGALEELGEDIEQASASKVVKWNNNVVEVLNELRLSDVVQAVAANVPEDVDEVGDDENWLDSIKKQPECWTSEIQAWVQAEAAVANLQSSLALPSAQSSTLNLSFFKEWIQDGLEAKRPRDWALKKNLAQLSSSDLHSLRCDSRLRVAFSLRDLPLLIVAQRFPNVHELIKDISSNAGFQTVKPKKKKNLLQQWINLGYSGSAAAAESIDASLVGEAYLRQFSLHQLDRLNAQNRQRVAHEIKRVTLDHLSNEYVKTHTTLRAYLESDTLKAMREVNVVGMTTSKASEIQTVLTALGPKIVVCEEAGEINEASLMTALCAETEHLILIGDHQQLRPKFNTHDLAKASGKKIDADVSSFERLVTKQHIEMRTLTTQRRMRPEIADLLRASLYRDLKDHPSVLEHPPLRGLDRSVVFFHHENPEKDKSSSNDTSKSNLFEAEFVAWLTLYFIQQGYAQDGCIVILTPYVGQMYEIEKRLTIKVEINEQDEELLKQTESFDLEQRNNHQRLPKTLKSCVRLATVDNFQGEEGDVVIISTVRNNSREEVGFLKDPSRVNVALSRARHGMVVLGNFKAFERRGGEMWKNVLQHARKKGAVQSQLNCICAIHPDRVAAVKSVNDFKQVPDGGCYEMCDSRLPCGHACPKRCHPDDRLHKFAGECKASCTQVCANALHVCRKLCFQDCDEQCLVLMKRPFELTCGHVAPQLQCYQVQTNGDDVNSLKPNDTVVCPVQCQFVLECNHVCKRPHVQCQHDQGCLMPCPKRQFCDHACSLLCGHPGDCPPCKRTCTRRCEHSACNKLCTDECVICVEPHCEWSCEHYQCKELCGLPCERRLCNEPCTKRLSCGHACLSLCGEPCPDPRIGCRECANSQAKDSQVDFINLNTMRELEPSERLISLRCGHSFTPESLDGHAGLREYYNLETGMPLAFRHGQEIANLTCPSCRTPLQGSVLRYSRLIKKKEVDRLMVLFQKHVTQEMEKFMPRVDAALQARVVENVVLLKANAESLLKALTKRDPLRPRGAAANDASGVIPALPSDNRWRQHFELVIKALDVAAAFEFSLVELQSFLKLVNGLFAVSKSQTVLRRGVSLAVQIVPPRHTAEALPWIRTVLLSRNNELSADTLKFCTELLTAEDPMMLLEIVAKADGYSISGSGYNGSGHVYTCPNGHHYLIGDCGGAMQESRCPDCGEKVGGQNHAVLGSNRAVWEGR